MNIEIPLSSYMHSEIYIYIPVPLEFTETGKPQEKIWRRQYQCSEGKNEKLNT